MYVDAPDSFDKQEQKRKKKDTWGQWAGKGIDYMTGEKRSATAPMITAKTATPKTQSAPAAKPKADYGGVAQGAAQGSSAGGGAGAIGGAMMAGAPMAGPAAPAVAVAGAGLMAFGAVQKRKAEKRQADYNAKVAQQKRQQGAINQMVNVAQGIRNL